jgi:hypothetical protein
MLKNAPRRYRTERPTSAHIFSLKLGGSAERTQGRLVFGELFIYFLVCRRTGGQDERHCGDRSSGSDLENFDGDLLSTELPTITTNGRGVYKSVDFPAALLRST